MGMTVGQSYGSGTVDRVMKRDKRALYRHWADASSAKKISFGLLAAGALAALVLVFGPWKLTWSDADAAIAVVEHGEITASVTHPAQPQKEGLKVGISAGPVSVSGSPEQVAGALRDGAREIATAMKEVNDFMVYEADRQRRWKNLANDFKARVRQAMEMRKVDRAAWEALPMQDRYQLLVGISFEQKGMTQEQRTEIKDLHGKIKSEYGGAHCANLADYAGQRYGYGGPGKKTVPYYNTIIASN